MSAWRLTWLLVSAAVLAPLGCSENDAAQTEADGDVARSVRPTLQWKRYAAIEADLSSALALPADELCTEFGVASCINAVHLAPLGGNDPFRSGLLEASAETLATTPAVIDRLLLSACGRRATRDEEAGPKDAVVFKGLDFGADAPDPGDDVTRGVISGLYERFLARRPTTTEIETVGSLTRDEDGDAVGAREFAVTACFAIGSSTEFEFY